MQFVFELDVLLHRLAVVELEVFNLLEEVRPEVAQLLLQLQRKQQTSVTSYLKTALPLRMRADLFVLVLEHVALKLGGAQLSAQVDVLRQQLPVLRDVTNDFRRALQADEHELSVCEHVIL